MCEPLEVRELLSVTVQSLTPTTSGFVAQLSGAVDTSVLNLYDAENGALGQADVTLRGSTVGAVAGSLVVEGSKLTFVATGGVLAADTYTVTLRSAANGVVDQALGQLLDGEYNGTFPSGDGVAGGDFIFNFTAASPQPLVISLPDFARGPTQAVNVPAQGSGQALSTGLPIVLSDAAGVTSGNLTVSYNPDLLTVSAVELGPDAPTGTLLESNLSVSGQVTIAFAIPGDPLSSGRKDLLRIIATVPDNAPYGATEVLNITNVEVNAGARQATTDAAIHVVAFPGDATRNGLYDTEDARLLARVGVALDTGFAIDQPTLPTPAQYRSLWPVIDPLVIGDVTGADGLSALDASDVLRQIVALSTPNIPAIPAHLAPTDIVLSQSSIQENQVAGTAVGTLSSISPETAPTFTYSLVSGAGSDDNATFTIDGNQLKASTSFDFETKSRYTVRLRSTDQNGLYREKILIITVSKANQPPTAIALTNNSLPENEPTGTTVGSLSTTDPDSGNTFTYLLVAGDGDTDNASFTIDGNVLKTATTLDFDTKPSYSVRIQSTDQGGLSFVQTFTISVTNVNEAPTAVALTNSSVPENEPAGTTVGLLGTTDPDTGNTFTYAFVTGDGDTDNASFIIDGNVLKTAATFDFETKPSYSVRIQSTDQGGLSFVQTLTISVTNVNEAPTAVALTNSSVAENEPVGTTVGLLSTTDPDSGNTFTYSFAAGAGDTDNASFTIDGNVLKTAATLDFATKSSYTVRVSSTDQGGLSTQQIFTISVTNQSYAAKLTVYVNGQQVTIPASVGVASGGALLSQVHTTASDGTLQIQPIANEALQSVTLGDFFETWRTNAGQAGNNSAATLTANELLGNVADTSKTVQMFVNGQVSTAFDNYVIHDGDQIDLVFGANPVVSLNTNFGPIVMELYESQTPGTVANFLNYVNDSDYLNSFFHRSVSDFVIQGGGFTTTSTTFANTSQFSSVPTDAAIQNEPGISNVRGTVAMAKLSGDPNSATSQFFVNLSDSNSFLDSAANNSFTVFGRVLDMTTVNTIAALPVNTDNASPFGELPLSSTNQLAVIQSIQGLGQLTGVKFLDSDGDGVHDANEQGIGGVTMFLDSNNNGVRDAGEATTTTDANGRYLFQVTPGTYTIRAEVTSGRTSTVPVSPDGRTVTVGIGREVSGLDFGEN